MATKPIGVNQAPKVHPKEPMTGLGQAHRLAPEPSLAPTAHPAVPQTGLKPSKQSPA